MLKKKAEQKDEPLSSPQNDKRVSVKAAANNMQLGSAFRLKLAAIDTQRRKSFMPQQIQGLMQLHERKSS